MNVGPRNPRARSMAFSLLLPILVLASTWPMVALAQDPAPDPDELLVPDPKGDWGLFQGLSTGTSTTTTPLTDAIDFTHLRVYGEDGEGLSIELGVVNLKAPASVIIGNSHNFLLSFKLDGTSAGYSLNWNVFSSAAGPSGVQGVNTRFCLLADGRGCQLQRAIGTVNWDKGLIVANITKAALLGRDARDGSNSPGPESLVGLVGVGARLTGFMATSSGGSAFFASDRLPNQGTGGPFVMKHPAANDRLRLSISVSEGEDQDPFVSSFFGTVQDYPIVTVTAGATSLVHLRVENGNAGKRIVNLSTEFVTPGDANHWDVRVVPTLTIPGSESRVVNLIINSTAQVKHLDSALIRIHARSLGFADEFGALKIKLVGSVPPGPVRKDLFLHATKSQSGVNINGQCPATPVFNLFCNSRDGWLNTIEQDSRANSDKGVPMRPQFSGSGNAAFNLGFRLDTTLGADLVLDPMELATVAVNFRSTLPIQATADLQLLSGSLLVGGAAVPVSIGSTGTAKAEFLPSLEAARIPRGEDLFLRILLLFPLASTSGPAWAGSVEIVPEGSKITLPAIPDPKAKAAQAIPAGPVFITLSPEGDTEEFVNPGRVRVFEVTVVNEGIQEDVVSIEATKDPEQWYVDLKPGSAYRLGPGESATFGVLVKPPSGAKEGEQGHVVLNATSQADSAAGASLFLTAIVTSGVDIPDESENYTADEETAMSLAAPESKGRSPGLGVLGILAVLASVGIVARRRRTA